MTQCVPYQSVRFCDSPPLAGMAGGNAAPTSPAWPLTGMAGTAVLGGTTSVPGTTVPFVDPGFCCAATKLLNEGSMAEMVKRCKRGNLECAMGRYAPARQSISI